MGRAAASARVLIVDPEPGRGARTARLLGDAGFDCERIVDGATALRRALAEPPGAILGWLPLPLLDAQKLAEILGSNPRTRDVRCVYIGDTDSRSADSSGRVTFLTPEQGPEAILSRLKESLSEDTGPAEEPADSSTEREMGPATRSHGLLDEAQCRRLRCQLRKFQAAPGPLTGRLVVAAASSGALQRFAHQLLRAPGAWLAQELREGSAPGLTSIGHLVVADEVGIEFLLLPASPRLAPLWPLACYGALGALLLFEAPRPKAECDLGVLAAALSAQADLSVVPALLGDADREPDPSALLSTCPWIDAAALACLPGAVSGRDLGPLRALLSRVVS